jgi:hypothetical protein
MAKVTKAMKSEDDMDRIIRLLPGKVKAIGVVHSCFAADKKIWGIHGTQVTPPNVQFPGQKVGEHGVTPVDRIVPGLQDCGGF